MEIFFHDPNDIPLPPEEVRIRTLKAQPYPDGKRVHIFLETTPFQQRPSGEITILNAAGEPVARASIIETINPKMEMTLHLRVPETSGTYSVKAEIYYTEAIPELSEENPPPTYELPERRVVDRAEVTLTIE